MICQCFNNFPPCGRLIGIDWGEKRVGVAVSTGDRQFVFVRESMKCNVKSMIEIADAENVVGIVVGLPLRLDGTESDTTVRVRKFATLLSGATNLPILLFDESLTSFEAEESVMYKVKSKSMGLGLDSEAAKVMLENAIAAQKRAARI